jgi:long-chain acyl-CoA synthetase
MSNIIKAENLALLYGQAAERYESLPAFAIRRSELVWRPVSYREVFEEGLALATGLIDLGVKARDHVGIFGDNRYEWILADYGVILAGAADVPRGRDVTDAELLYIINHAGIEVAFVETEALQDKVLRFKDQMPLLREIILLDPRAKAREGVRKLKDVRIAGACLRREGDRRAEERIAGVRPDDLFTLIYTSGTTGQPKGVMLTHANMASQIRNIPAIHACTDRVLSVLPIWHIFERVIEMYTISFGGCTYYSSILTLADDMRNVEPTFMASAPRLWEKLHERIIQNVKESHPVRQVLFHMAYYLAKQYKVSEFYITGKHLKITSEPKWKRLLLLPFHLVRWAIVLPWYGFFNAAVLERIRLGAGGSLRNTISGGGALPIHIDKFFNFVGIPVLEGYGMTETSPVISVRPANNLVVGTVGPPIPETRLRIVDPETGEILYPDPSLPDEGRSKRGEIWVNGPQVMKGYYKDPDLTAQTLHNGWLRTGDIGVITHNNCLKILGRSKATIVLSSGENVEPEPLEMHLQQSRFIDYCMVVGQDKKHLGALIVPGLDGFREYGFTENSVEELTRNPKTHDIIRQEIRRMNTTSNGFKQFERIRDFRLLTNGFQVGHEMTNLYKVKRHIVEKKFGHVIEDLYN